MWFLVIITIKYKSELCMKLTTHLHLVQRLRTHGAEPQLLHMSSRCGI
jgi:hypothetical protein